MFLNNLSIYSIPFIGIIFLIISLTFSKTRNLFTYQLSTKENQRQPVISHINDSHISIHINPFSELDNYQQQSITLPLDDDDELIKSDISASNFCETDSIELRLDQDLEYDNDIAHETDN